MADEVKSEKEDAARIIKSDDFQKAMFETVCFAGADFKQVCFGDTALSNVCMRRMRLNDACLSEAELDLVDLSNVTVTNADVTGMTVNGFPIDQMIEKYKQEAFCEQDDGQLSSESALSDEVPS